jgi:hypothetical protein
VRCDEIEDTEQQIYKCKEAKKMWTLYYRIIGKIGLQECKIFNFEDIVLSRKEDTEQIEILKATIIKHNIQINRPTFNRNLLQQLLANIELQNTHKKPPGVARTNKRVKKRVERGLKTSGEP